MKTARGAPPEGAKRQLERIEIREECLERGHPDRDQVRARRRVVGRRQRRRHVHGTACLRRPKPSSRPSTAASSCHGAHRPSHRRDHQRRRVARNVSGSDRGQHHQRRRRRRARAASRKAAPSSGARTAASSCACRRRQGHDHGQRHQRRHRHRRPPLETTESSRRRLVGRLNGGGPRSGLEGTNGGITIAPTLLGASSGSVRSKREAAAHLQPAPSMSRDDRRVAGDSLVDAVRPQIACRRRSRAVFRTTGDDRAYRRARLREVLPHARLEPPAAPCPRPAAATPTTCS